MTRPSTARRILLAVAGLLVIGSVATLLAYSSDLRAAAARVASGSRIAATGRGPVEYAAWGSGPTVLVVHGSGGGHDQGVLVARHFGGDGFHWVSVSRFGYLGSPLPADASTAAQADAFAALLDRLGHERVGIVAISGGVPPALQFALRHPGRLSALVLLSSAPYTPLGPDEGQRPVPTWLYEALFGSEFPYWLLRKLARGSLERMFDVTPARRAALTPGEREMLDGLVDSFQPVTRRVAGIRNEAAAIDPRATYPLERIAAPTLVVHAADDGLNPFRIGEHAAGHIPGAEFVRLETGGHLLLGHHDEVRARVRAFLGLHAVTPGGMP
jgi:pimeloyl-ACP methyl ester carboxylesterase